MTPDHFPDAVAFLFKDEGGYVNNPHDSGGPTKYGVTLRTLSGWRARECTVDDIKALEQVEAAAIYRARYWDANRLGEIENAWLATILLNAVVLFGARTVVKIVQTATGFEALGLTADGVVGDHFLTVTNSSDPNKLALLIKNQLVSYVAQIVAAQPKNRIFQNGWLARVNRYTPIVA